LHFHPHISFFSDALPARVLPERVDHVRAVLRSNPVFKELSRETVDDVCRVAWKISVPARTVIFTQGDPAGTLYIIKKGKVRLFKRGTGGLDFELGHMRAGDCFGAISLLSGNPRMRSAETIEDSELLFIEKQDYEQIRENPQITAAFMKHFSTVVQQVDQKLESEATSRYHIPSVSVTDFAAIFILSLLLGLAFNFTNPLGVKVIPELTGHEAGVPKEAVVAAADKYVKTEALFVDARPPQYYQQRHVKGALNIPAALFDIMYLMQLSGVDKERELIVYGNMISSPYDLHVAKKLKTKGHPNVRILSGSIDEWKDMGYPVEP
jgi:CRP-like cAMP-binding protein/rhodanese-related sulfurtransferase